LLILYWFIFYFQGYGGLFSNLIFIFNIKFKKAVGTCFSHASVLVASVLFWRRMQRRYLSLKASLCDFTLGVKCVNGGPTVYYRWSFLLFFSYFYLSSSSSTCLSSLFFCFSTSLCMFLIAFFVIDHFLKKIYVFNSIFKL